MKIKEPIKKRCPRCRRELTFSLEWILQEGQVCRFCQHDLSDLRSGIRLCLDELGEKWRLFANITETALAIEDEYSICFDDQDLYKNEYEITLSDIVESTNRILKANGKIVNPEDLKAQILKIVRQEFPNEAFEIEPQTKLSDLGRSK